MKEFFFQTVSSTNTKAKEYIAKNPNDPDLANGIIFVAEEQSQGRGTKNKYWESKPGGLYYSLLIYLPLFRLNQSFLLVKGVGECVINVLNKNVGIQPYLEWPNDIILGHKKMGGILIESITKAKTDIPKAIIMGIGLNLNQETFDSNLAPFATSVRQITGKIVSKSEIISALNKELSTWLYEEYVAQPQLNLTLKKKS